jgi:hypothetical protein
LESGGAARERARAAADVARQKRLAETERTVANLVAAIKAGILTPTTKAELLAAEAARDTARAEAAAAPAAEQNVRRLLPEALTLYKRMVQELPAMLDREPDRAREILRRLLGAVRLVREAGGLFAELATSPGQLLALAGGAGSGGALHLFPQEEDA